MRNVPRVRYPLLPECRHDDVIEQRVILSCRRRLALHIGMLGEKALREVRSSRRDFRRGPAPAGSLPFAASASSRLATLRAHSDGIDVGREDLSILL
jgi:hypothetical protein